MRQIFLISFLFFVVVVVLFFLVFFSSFKISQNKTHWIKLLSFVEKKAKVTEIKCEQVPSFSSFSSSFSSAKKTIKLNFFFFSWRRTSFYYLIKSTKETPGKKKKRSMPEHKINSRRHSLDFVCLSHIIDDREKGEIEVYWYRRMKE